MESHRDIHVQRQRETVAVTALEREAERQRNSEREGER